MAASKAKTAVKKSAAPKPAKAKSKPTAKPKAPKKQPVKVVTKAQIEIKPVAQNPKAPPLKTVPPKNESVFARLLREKAERHHQFQKQNEHHQGPHDANRPAGHHASFAKFAGPRRRAS